MLKILIVLKRLVSVDFLKDHGNNVRLYHISCGIRRVTVYTSNVAKIKMHFLPYRMELIQNINFRIQNKKKPFVNA